MKLLLRVFFYYIYLLIYVCLCVSVCEYIWRPEDNLWKSFLSFHYVGLGV